MDGEMQAVRKMEQGPGLGLTKIPIPQVKDDELLLKTLKCSICGSDVHIYDWEAPWDTAITPPMTVGHEGFGEVVEIGDKVEGWEIGDHASPESHFHCGECDMCVSGHENVCRNMRGLGMGGADGTYAEYLVVPAKSAWKIDKNISAEVGTLQEPYGNAVYTVAEGDVEGKTVAIFGCGPIGIMACAVAKALGAEKVIGISATKEHLDLAKEMGADMTINREEEDVLARLMEETDNKGVDVFLEMSGAGVAIEQGFEAVKKSGNVVLLGLPTKPIAIDWAKYMVLKDLNIKGIYGRKIWDSWKLGTELIEAGKVDLSKLITHRFKLSEFEEAFEVMKGRKCGKVVMDPSG